MERTLEVPRATRVVTVVNEVNFEAGASALQLALQDPHARFVAVSMIPSGLSTERSLEFDEHYATEKGIAHLFYPIQLGLSVFASHAGQSTTQIFSVQLRNSSHKNVQVKVMNTWRRKGMDVDRAQRSGIASTTPVVVVEGVAEPGTIAAAKEEKLDEQKVPPQDALQNQSRQPDARILMDMVVQSKLAIASHKSLAMWMMLYETFVEPLPRTKALFCEGLHLWLPSILDVDLLFVDHAPLDTAYRAASDVLSVNEGDTVFALAGATAPILDAGFESMCIGAVLLASLVHQARRREKRRRDTRVGETPPAQRLFRVLPELGIAFRRAGNQLSIGFLA
jgi:hypothetical protein